jgi:hypothetical protein
MSFQKHQGIASNYERSMESVIYLMANRPSAMVPIVAIFSA